MVTPDHRLWITGGLSGATKLESTLLVSGDGPSEKGPNLPNGFFHHAIVSINGTTSSLIGGMPALGTVTDATYYFSHETGQWMVGPKLIQARLDHTAGLVTDKVTNETFVIVVGGQSRIQTTNFEVNTTEILMDGNWVSGEKYYHHAMNIVFWLFFVQLDHQQKQ